MTCQIIVSDYVAERRMAYLLDDDDFAGYLCRQDETDELLRIFHGHPFFAGCQRWGDLTMQHCHALIINILKVSARHSDAEVSDKKHAAVSRLTFLLCALVARLEAATGSAIDLLRLARVGADDVTYDYSARLDIKLARPKTPLRVVIDND